MFVLHEAASSSSQLFPVAINSPNGALITRYFLVTLLGSSFIMMTNCLDQTGANMLPFLLSITKSPLPVVPPVPQARTSSDHDDGGVTDSPILQPTFLSICCMLRFLFCNWGRWENLGWEK